MSTRGHLIYFIEILKDEVEKHRACALLHLGGVWMNKDITLLDCWYQRMSSTSVASMSEYKCSIYLGHFKYVTHHS